MSSLIDDPMYDSEKKTFAIRTKVKSKGQDENLLSTTMKWVEDKQVKNKRPEIQEYYERRRMLERMISKIYSKDSSIPGKAETTVDLIQKLQEEEIMRLQERNCISFRDLREIDEDFAD